MTRRDWAPHIAVGAPLLVAILLGVAASTHVIPEPIASWAFSVAGITVIAYAIYLRQLVWTGALTRRDPGSASLLPAPRRQYLWVLLGLWAALLALVRLGYVPAGHLWR